jgi:hypothetical protein
MLLTLLTPIILKAQTRDYGTTRQPRACPSRSQPTNGPITPELATMYVICREETDRNKLYGNGQRYFADIQNLQVAPKSRRVTLSEINRWENVDVDKPVYDIKGDITTYACGYLSSSYSNVGRNCTIFRRLQSTGRCYQTTFGEWYCSMSTGSKPETGAPPAN